MRITQELNDLLLEAYQLSREVSEAAQIDIYEHFINARFGDISIPSIIVETTGEEVLKLLVRQNLLGRYTLDAHFTPTNDLAMGVLYVFNETKERKRTEFQIRVDSTQTPEWQSFILLKEICQIYCDRKRGVLSTSRENVNGQIYHLLRQHGELSNGQEVFDVTPDDKNYTEFLSFYMAVNLVFPEYFRNDMITIASERSVNLDSYAHTFNDIAEATKLPPFIIKLFVNHMMPIYKDN